MYLRYLFASLCEPTFHIERDLSTIRGQYHAVSTNSLEMHSIALRIIESGQRRLAGFHQFLLSKIPLFYIQLSNIITRHSYH